jgi:hypothetical protein
MNIYVASSWKTPTQPILVQVLREHGHKVYDFRHPKNGQTGFGWNQLDLGDPGSWNHLKYLEALATPRAQEGFKSDMDALRDCDACVLVQPCGNSAHLELGWAIGAGKLTAVLLEPTPKADLMLLAADVLLTSTGALLEWLKRAQIPCRAGRGCGPCACRSCVADRAIDP